MRVLVLQISLGHYCWAGRLTNLYYLHLRKPYLTGDSCFYWRFVTISISIYLHRNSISGTEFLHSFSLTSLIWICQPTNLTEQFRDVKINRDQWFCRRTLFFHDIPVTFPILRALVCPFNSYAQIPNGFGSLQTQAHWYAVQFNDNDRAYRGMISISMISWSQP
jgi:hypothetical protein